MSISHASTKARHAFHRFQGTEPTGQGRALRSGMGCTAKDEIGGALARYTSYNVHATAGRRE